MPNCKRITTVLGACALITVASPVKAQSGSLDAVNWLVSCWEANSGTRRVIERWFEPSGGEMKGNSRTIVGPREVEGERLRIYGRGDTLIYDAHPSGQARTEFRGRATSASEIVFENPAHDFPQRISYRRVGSDSLIARVEGDRAGRRAPLTFAYRRIDCSGVSASPAEVAEAALRVHYDELVAMLNASVTGLNAWFAKHGSPGFGLVFWARAGYRAPVVTKEQVDRIMQASQTNPSASTTTDPSNSIAIQSSLLRGDTAEVLIALRLGHKYVDTPGRYGPAGERRALLVEQTRLDKWIRHGDKWTLANAALVAEDVLIEGRLIQRNGKAVELPK